MRNDVKFNAPMKLAKRYGSNEYDNPNYRDEFMRDRDRVLYSTAFRRLSGKTQIYRTGDNDHRRNRLTHTLEVAQISRTIAKALNLDENLTEAIALGHDLGHTPFGHAGEKMLHEIMECDSGINKNKSIKDSPFCTGEEVQEKDVFGFKHNIQSVRVATKIENGYGENGLNLTNFTLWGMLNHSNLQYKENNVDTQNLSPDYINALKKYICHDNDMQNEAWSFEAFVVREADEIAQWHHDMEDALYSKAMSMIQVFDVVNNNLSIMIDEGSEMQKALIKLEQDIKNANKLNTAIITNFSRIIVNTLVTYIIKCSQKNLNLLWLKYMDGRSEEERLEFYKNSCNEKLEGTGFVIKEAIGFKCYGQESCESGNCGASAYIGQQSQLDYTLRNYPNSIRLNIHHSLEVERMNAKGQYIIKKLFEAYYAHPQQLSDNTVIRYMKCVCNEEWVKDLIKNGEIKSIQGAIEHGVGSVRNEFETLLNKKSKNEMPTKCKIELMRCICDYIASMTDTYAIKEYNNLYE